ncbi:Putative High mobility group box domain-containing protein [Colletotrichum destructivum]|uniref:High mobility group box domain-containing protein n=1 Tax=Colletotrichum destructivum TaxID=34406 RepID=A0AAX4HZ07_9PEZI|nr:Putative High mobility group box domain-containing protein [Colletotrichum destructivum]
MAPQSAIPPSLPPSVEEAYRRKCVQLKQRTGEVEEENDATRVRLARIRRQIEKLRLERAFLLEQLAKRTSTNVEDSDGSPSPPPTPQEKPLRTKRGHRKPSVLAEIDSAAKANSRPLSQTAATISPSSETFSHTQGGGGGGRGGDTQASARTNGIAKPPKRPGNAFELYCADTRPVLEEKSKNDADVNVDEELARGWKDLPEGEKEEFQTRSEEEMAKYHKDKDAFAAKSKNAEPKEDEEERDKSPQEAPAASQDEDVEMGNYDTEEQPEDTPAADDKDDKADD